MRFKTVGNKVDKAFIVVRNPSSTVTIPFGAACYFTMTSTGVLGVDVQNANAAAGVGQGFFAGIVSESAQQGLTASGLGPGQYGEAQVFGFVQSLRLVCQTRAASNSSFTTASGALGDILAPLTATANGPGGVTNYDGFSDIGANLTITGSYASASATTASNSVVVNAGGANNLDQFAVAAQSWTVSASASSAINALVSGSTIMFTTLAINAFLNAL